MRTFPFGVWSGKRVSNSRPIPWQGIALPTELFPRGSCPGCTALFDESKPTRKHQRHELSAGWRALSTAVNYSEIQEANAKLTVFTAPRYTSHGGGGMAIGRGNSRAPGGLPASHGLPLQARSTATIRSFSSTRKRAPGQSPVRPPTCHGESSHAHSRQRGSRHP